MSSVFFPDDGLELRGELPKAPRRHLRDTLCTAKPREATSRSPVTLIQAKPLREAISWFECIACFHGKCVVRFHGNSIPKVDV